jgi:hypothetical protein
MLASSHTLSHPSVVKISDFSSYSYLEAGHKMRNRVPAQEEQSSRLELFL